MPYIVKEAKRLTLLCADMPRPSPELKDVVNDMLRLMKHPLAVPIETTTDVYVVKRGKVTATKSTPSKRRGRPPKRTLAEQLMEIE